MRIVLALALLAPLAPAKDFFFARVGHLEDYPKSIARGKKLVLKGVTRGAFRKAELIIIAPDGSTFLNKKNEVVEADFTFTVEFEHGPGRYRMEIIAHKQNSTRTLARFSVYHAAPYREEAEPPPPEGPATPRAIHPRLVEKRWLRRLNEFRARLRLKPVRWNEAASARCREHAVRQARARRHIHKFPPHGGVEDMLARDGAGPKNWAGPTDPWTRISDRRPFPRPAPQLPGPRLYNYLVPFVQADDPVSAKVMPSLERLFVATFEREAAHRICAADPNCLEIGIGIARPERAVTTGKGKPKRKPLRDDALYYAIVFLQVNDKRQIEAQDRYYADLLRQAAAKRTPGLLQRLGVWGRPKGARVLKKALRDKDPALVSAALDGLLLLDESKALAGLEKVAAQADGALRRGDYGKAAAAWRPYVFVVYDARIRWRAKNFIRDVEKGAKKELGNRLLLEDPDERRKALQALLPRVRGLAIEPKVKAALKDS